MEKNIVALVDFGSTFTKVVLVEAGNGSLLAASKAPTTVETDVIYGYKDALSSACSSLPFEPTTMTKLAASSAGGGLSVAAIGLVEDYTARAARQAALNAGAKVEIVLTGRLDITSINALNRLSPDILLFSGGTDGGQTRQVIDNAKMLTNCCLEVPIIVACNSEIAGNVADILGKQFYNVEITENVLPEIDTMNIEPARSIINKIFIEQVIIGKGLSQSKEFSQAVIMPTPEAVLIAIGLLSKGTTFTEGVGDLLAVDIGGATTDVHSAIDRFDLNHGISMHGLQYPPLSRSVQGDLGMRWSALSTFNADANWLVSESRKRNLHQDTMKRGCQQRNSKPHFLARDETNQWIDEMLAVSCTTLSLERHCGSMRAVYIQNQGVDLVQEGINCRNVPLLIGTGGMLAYDAKGEVTLKTALARQTNEVLSPESPDVVIDRKYILGAAGILSTIDPQAAFNLMKSELIAEAPMA